MEPRRYLIGQREPAITSGWAPYAWVGLSAEERQRPAAPGLSLGGLVSLLSILTASLLAPFDIQVRTTRDVHSAAGATSASADGPPIASEAVPTASSSETPADAPSTRTGRARTMRAYTKQEVQALIREYARAHGIDPRLPLAIAACESGFRWNAANGQSSARGVFQYLSGTWRSTEEGRKGASVLDAEANIRMAIRTIATLGTTPWAASRRCWGEGARS